MRQARSISMPATNVSVSRNQVTQHQPFQAQASGCWECDQWPSSTSRIRRGYFRPESNASSGQSRTRKKVNTQMQGQQASIVFGDRCDIHSGGKLDAHRTHVFRESGGNHGIERSQHAAKMFVDKSRRIEKQDKYQSPLMNMLTLDPRECKMPANSTAMYPAPTTAHFSGT